jgi:spermidine/putrescine transport system substrate-binding protein
MWATTALLAMEESRDIAFVYPREGFALYADNAVILRESRRREMAHEFLDFLLEPSVAAPNAVGAHAATANAEARELLPETVRQSPVIYPDRETLARGQWFRPLRYWTEIKSA